MAVLGLRFCARAFSSCGKRGPLFIVVRGPLTIAGSLVVEHRLQTRRLNNCGSRAQLLRDMWVLPRPGLEPVSPALAGRFLTTAPPGKPSLLTFDPDCTALLRPTPAASPGPRVVENASPIAPTHGEEANSPEETPAPPGSKVPGKRLIGQLAHAHLGGGVLLNHLGSDPAPGEGRG